MSDCGTCRTLASKVLAAQREMSEVTRMLSRNRAGRPSPSQARVLDVNRKKLSDARGNLVAHRDTHEAEA